MSTRSERKTVYNNSKQRVRITKKLNQNKPNHQHKNQNQRLLSYWIACSTGERAKTQLTQLEYTAHKTLLALFHDAHKLHTPNKCCRHLVDRTFFQQRAPVRSHEPFSKITPMRCSSLGVSGPRHTKTNERKITICECMKNSLLIHVKLKQSHCFLCRSHLEYYFNVNCWPHRTRSTVTEH